MQQDEKGTWEVILYISQNATKEKNNRSIPCLSLHTGVAASEVQTLKSTQFMSFSSENVCCSFMEVFLYNYICQYDLINVPDIWIST